MIHKDPAKQPSGQYTITLRDVLSEDLPVFYLNQLDPLADEMAAFTAKDPTDRAAFDAHWAKIMADPTVLIKTILVDGAVAGSILKYVMFDEPQISYWLGRTYWGKGIATQALHLFLQILPERPLFARAAKHNLASIRVLEKCGFKKIGEEMGFANAFDREIEEIIFELTE